MLLEDLYPKAKCTILNNKKIYTVEEFLRIQPKIYHDYRMVDILVYEGELKRKIDNNINAVVKVVIQEVSYDNVKKYLKVKARCIKTGNKINCFIYGAFKEREYYYSLVEKEVYIGGSIGYSEEFKVFSCFSPDFITKNDNCLKIMPVYKKIQGVSEDAYEKMFQTGMINIEYEEYIPKKLLNIYGIESFKECIKGLRYPSDRNDVKKAYDRIKYEDLAYFTAKVNLSNRNETDTKFLIEDTCLMDNFIKSFPFELTSDQAKTINELINRARRSKIYSLVQGDVGCGKTCIAFALMFAFASNKDFQSVLIAPTTILAYQHYLELKEYADKLGVDIVYLASNISVKEQKEAIKKIKEGCSLIVGTHSCFNKSVKYKNLALVITDEEHRFGVLQKQELMNRCKNDGVHSIIMSATPIPRTIASSVYGNMIDVNTISTLPGSRKERKTALVKQDKTVADFILKELKAGHQAYIVCPLIEKNINSDKMKNVMSTDEVYKLYGDFFFKEGFKTGLVTGKTKEKDEILKQFSENKIQVLVSTSVIEVGVNVPNATVICISSAERFGLASLHQLRGRVGRSNLQSYCILKQSAGCEDSERLKILCETNDGFKLAVEDFKLRGSGDLFGLEQSGDNKHIKLMITNPSLYKDMQKTISEIDKSELIRFINKYEELYKQNMD